jgi:hypothetical protein
MMGRPARKLLAETKQRDPPGTDYCEKLTTVVKSLPYGKLRDMSSGNLTKLITPQACTSDQHSAGSVSL